VQGIRDAAQHPVPLALFVFWKVIAQHTDLVAAEQNRLINDALHLRDTALTLGPILMMEGATTDQRRDNQARVLHLLPGRQDRFLRGVRLQAVRLLAILKELDPFVPGRLADSDDLLDRPCLRRLVGI
jgi:hypothetical protein